MPSFNELWDNSSSDKSSSASSSFDEMWNSGVSKKKGAVEKSARVGAQYGIGLAEKALLPYELGAQLLSSPNTAKGAYVAKAPQMLAVLERKKASGNWTEKDEELLQSITSKLRNPEKIDIKPPDLTVGGLVEKGASLAGYDLKPEGLEEHGARLAGNIFSPKSLLNGTRKAAGATKNLFAGKEARSAIKAEKGWKNLESAAKGNAEKESLLNFAKNENLSPEATNLLFHSEGKAETLSRVAKKGKKFKEPVEELKSKLGNSYEKLKFFGRTGGEVNPKVRENLSNNLDRILKEMQNTHVIGPDSKQAMSVLKETADSVKKGGTVETLINSRMGLNEGANWGKIDKGNFFKGKIKDALTDAIGEANPSIHKRLLETDKQWVKYSKYQDALGKKLPFIKWNGAEIPKQWLVGAAFLSPLVPIVGPTVAKGLVIKEAIQRAATQWLVNPKFQAPLKRLKQAILKGDTNAQKSAALALKNLTKTEEPELYEGIKDLEFD